MKFIVSLYLAVPVSVAGRYLAASVRLPDLFSLAEPSTKSATNITTKASKRILAAKDTEEVEEVDEFEKEEKEEKADEYFKVILNCVDHKQSCAKKSFGQCPNSEIEVQNEKTNSPMSSTESNNWSSSIMDWIADHTGLGDTTASSRLLGVDKKNMDVHFDNNQLNSTLDRRQLGSRKVRSPPPPNNQVCAIDVPLLSSELLAEQCCCSRWHLSVLDGAKDIHCSEFDLCSFVCCNTTETICGTECCGSEDICGTSIDDSSTTSSCCLSPSDPNDKCCPWGVGYSCTNGEQCCKGTASNCVGSLYECSGDSVATWLLRHGITILVVMIIAAMAVCCCCCCY